MASSAVLPVRQTLWVQPRSRRQMSWVRRGPRTARREEGCCTWGSRIRWRSIFKIKGLDAEAAVLTDVDERARAFIEESGLDWKGLLYVRVTRGRYRCVVLRGGGE